MSNNYNSFQGWDWTFYDKKTGQRLIHISQAIKPQKHVKIRANANPYDEQWAEYFKTRDKNTKLKRMYGLRFKVYHKQQEVCTCCKQPLNMKQIIELHHNESVSFVVLDQLASRCSPLTRLYLFIFQVDQSDFDKKEQLFINVDYTTDTDDFFILGASMRFQGQSIPLYFSMQKYPKRAGRHDQKKWEEAFFRA